VWDRLGENYERDAAAIGKNQSILFTFQLTANLIRA
jgi:hypothetical protein